MPSKPIAIPNNSNSDNGNYSAHNRSPSSDDDDVSSPPLVTPPLSPYTPRVRTSASPSTSPIFSYFFSPQQKYSDLPTTASTLSRTFAAAKISSSAQATTQNDTAAPDSPGEAESPLVRHARRFSTSSGWPPGPRLPVAVSATSANPNHERGAGVLRRLSLGGTLSRPQVVPPTSTAAPAMPPPPPPPPSAVSPPPGSGSKPPVPPARKARRSTMLGVSGEGRPRRAPSPMGERILKGHFDGFN